MDSSWFPENNNLHHDQDNTDHRIHTVVDKTSINNKIMNNKSAAELVQQQQQHPVSKSRNLSRQNYSFDSALNNTSSTVLPSISANIVMSSSNATSSTTSASTSNITTRNSVGRLQKAMTLPVQEDSQSSQLLGNTNTWLV